MKTSKIYTKIDGQTRSFLSDFIIASDNHVRVFNHINFLPVIGDLVSTTKYSLINGNIVFNNAPLKGSFVTLEVTTDPLEFIDTIELPNLHGEGREREEK
jgi:hypothetical protein